MSTLVPISNENSSATISTHGATVTSWKVQDLDVLFPETELPAGDVKKRRGGIQLLFPYAGVLANNPSHGYARDREWQIVDKQEDLVRLQLLTDEFKVRVDVYVRPGRLIHELKVKNLSNKIHAIAPGLHPYLSLQDKKKLTITINGFNPTSYNWSDTLSFPYQPEVIINQTKMLVDANYQRLMIWSEPNQQFVCVEPWVGETGAIQDKDQCIFLEPNDFISFIVEFQHGG